jgi:hypothetical protein
VGAAEALGGPLHDSVEHPVRIGVQLRVPHPQNRPTLVRQEGVAPNIALTIRMLATVQLEDELRLPTGEIRNVRPDRQLPRELRPQPRDQVPKRNLMPRRLVAQPPRALRIIQRNAPAHALSLTPGGASRTHPQPLPSREGNRSACCSHRLAPPPLGWAERVPLPIARDREVLDDIRLAEVMSALGGKQTFLG